MIKPTVGRVVWYYPNYKIEQPYAALITYVHSNEVVNLVVFDKAGHSDGVVNVFLKQEESIQTDYSSYNGHAEWMPYQIGQAKAQTQV